MLNTKPLPWREENDSYVMTAYFKDPGQICSRKPSYARYIGDRLLILNNTAPQDFIQAPLLEDGLSKSAWTEGECFWTMGKSRALTLKGPLRTAFHFFILVFRVSDPYINLVAHKNAFLTV